MNCPMCSSSQTKVIETRQCHNGTRRQRLQCHDCEHRWTLWHGERPKRGRVDGAAAVKRIQPRLTEEEIRFILTTQQSGHTLGPELGRSKEAISAIRRGITYKDVCPDLPRWNHGSRKVSCLNCIHWDERCGMGFPDPAIEGLGFAADCSVYERS